MKVIHVITRLELGGAQENTLFTLGRLDPRRFSGLLVTSPEGLLTEEAGKDGRYRAIFLPSLLREIRPLADVRALVALVRLLRREVKSAGGDGGPPSVIVHTHSSKAGILGRTAARLAGVPVIIHSIHGYGFHRYQPWAVRRFYIFLEKLMSRWTTHFIAVAQADIDRGVALGLFPREKATLIRSGIEIGRFRGGGVDVAAGRAALGLAPGGKVVGMVACFKPQKNPVDFVRLAAAVAEEAGEAEFVLVGDGLLRPQVEREVRRCGLEGRFHLLGWRRDIPRIMALFDVLVLTSLWEGLPRVFPQAMAAGLPIVAYRFESAPEAVSEGVNGFLVDPGDYRTAAGHVVRLLKNPDQAALLGAAGLERVGEFDAELMVRRQEELYERLWSERGGSFSATFRPEP